MTFVVNSVSVSPYPNLLLTATCFRCWFLQSPGNLGPKLGHLTAPGKILASPGNQDQNLVT